MSLYDLRPTYSELSYQKQSVKVGLRSNRLTGLELQGSKLTGNEFVILALTWLDYMIFFRPTLTDSFWSDNSELVGLRSFGRTVLELQGPTVNATDTVKYAGDKNLEEWQYITSTWLARIYFTTKPV